MKSVPYVKLDWLHLNIGLWCYLKNKNNDLRLGKMLAYGFKLVLKHPQIFEHSVWVLFIFYIE